MKNIQDAYIVAATRSAVGKSGRGSLKNTRPDDLLGSSLHNALSQVPSLDPKAIEDAIIGCAMPEAQQGLNIARIGLLLGGLPNSVGGITVNRFCSSGLNAIAMAADRIRVGEADVMIAGGAEAAICELAVAGFASARALSSRNDDPATASRHWDKDRDGFVIGEGAGVMVLEEYESAKKRGAKIYAELVGYGMSADAYHMTAPNMDGPRRSMRNALNNAGINSDEVQFVNAHGTSTPLGDANETNAIKAAFGDHAKNIVVNSTKSMTGHLLGGAGGLESVFTVLSIHHQISPPTINIFNQDPECDLDFCANTARDMKIEVALKNNFGFGGTNGSLVFKKI